MKTYQQDDLVKQKDRITAATGTAVLLILLLIVALLVGFRNTYSPMETEGAYVLLGVTEFGSPGESAPEYAHYEPEPTPASSPAKEPQNPVVSQEIEEAPVTVPKTEEKKNNESQQITQQVKEEKKPNPKFQFQSGSQEGTKGNTKTSGDQGSPGGDPNANKYGPGGGTGYSFELSGRTVLLAPPKIEDNSQEVAKIVIEIVVNRNGTVISAVPVYKKGATTAIGPLAEKAAAAALKVKFSPNPNAPEEQYGTITFNFKLN